MILVTGATGFVGRAVVERLVADDSSRQVVVAVRQKELVWPKGVEPYFIKSIWPSPNWLFVLKGITVVIHCAARVHVMNDHEADPLLEFRRINVEGTLDLARQAVAAGVRRFVFISTVKVNGEATQVGHPFTEDDTPAPKDAYAISKMEAEDALRTLALQTGMEVVIIRPPLIYGPGVKANFGAMMRWIQLGVPLPFGTINNLRSFVSLDNLVDLIVVCITHPRAANQTFLVSDGEDVSTTQLLRRIGAMLGCGATLVPVPISIIKIIGTLVCKPHIARRLCGTLQVNTNKIRTLLDWRPPLTLDAGLKKVLHKSQR